MHVFQLFRVRKKTLYFLLKAIFILLMLWSALTVFTKYFENISWNEALWQTWQTATTVGYGNKPPETVFGRIATAIFGTLNIFMLGVLFGKASEFRQEQRDRRRYGYMENKKPNSYVIINFPDEYRLITFIKEVRAVDPNSHFCIIDNNITEIPPSIEVFGDIHFIRGSLLKKETFKQANIDKSKVIVVFPSDFNDPDSDGKTITVINLLENLVTPKTTIMHVLIDPDNAWLFEHSRSIQVLEQLEILALVQECSDPYSSAIIEHILRNTKDNTKTVIPKKIIGWTWSDFTKKVADFNNGNPDQNINPIGIIRKTDKTIEIFANPSNSLIIKKDDLINVIASNQLDWSEYEKNLIHS